MMLGLTRLRWNEEYKHIFLRGMESWEIWDEDEWDESSKQGRNNRPTKPNLSPPSRLIRIWTSFKKIQTNAHLINQTTRLELQTNSIIFCNLTRAMLCSYVICWIIKIITHTDTFNGIIYISVILWHPSMYLIPSNCMKHWSCPPPTTNLGCSSALI